MLAATGASVALAFVTQLITARALGPEGQGVVATLQTSALLLASLLSLGVPWALFYFASQRREPQPALLGVSAIHATALAAVALVAAAVAGPALGDAQDVPGGRELYLIAAVLVPSTFLEYGYVDILRGQRRLSLANRILVASRVLALAATLLLVVLLDGGPRAALVAVLAASASQWLAALPVLLRGGVAFSRRVARRLLAYGLRVQGASVSRLLSRRFDVLLLSLFVPAGAVGHYAVAQTLAELTLLLPQAFGLAVSPLITGGDADRAVTRRVVRANGTAALAGVVLLAAAAPWLVTLAYGDAFEPAVLPLLLLLPGVWMFACGEMVSHVLAARGRPGAASWLSGLQAALTVALDLALIPAFGIEGAAVASASAYTAYGLVSLAVIARQDGVGIGRLLLASPGELRAYAGGLRTLVARR